MPLNDEDVREILRIIDESPLAELRIEMDGLSLYVSKASGSEATALGPAPRGAAEPVSIPTPSAPAPRASADGAGEADTQTTNGAVTIDAPLLGTFYRAEGPGHQPFVDVGSRVEPDTVVAIIEVMKMMNSVTAGVSGTIAEILPENTQLVEYGQPLFTVDPA